MKIYDIFKFNTLVSKAKMGSGTNQYEHKQVLYTVCTHKFYLLTLHTCTRTLLVPHSLLLNLCNRFAIVIPVAPGDRHRFGHILNQWGNIQVKDKDSDPAVVLAFAGDLSSPEGVNRESKRELDKDV